MEDFEPSRLFNKFYHFTDKAKNAFLYNNSIFYAAIGERRSGKSVFIMGMACCIDPDLDIEQICFNLDDLKGQLNTRTESAIIWEEAGASCYARDFMEERNKVLVKALQVYGYRKIALLGNLQHLKFIDGDVRLQLNHFFRMKAYNGFTSSGEPITSTSAEPWVVLTDWVRKPIVCPYKIEKEPEVYVPMGPIPIPQMDDFFELCGVKKALYKDYLKKKDEYFQEIGTEDEAEVKEIFSKRELKTLVRMDTAYLSLVSKMILEDHIPKNKIASMSDIPVSTLNVWLEKREELGSYKERVSSSNNNDEE